MAGSFPASNDREFDLWFRIAWNWYNYALNFGVSSLNPPSLNDTEFDLQKKVTYYTAASLAIHP